MAVTLNAKGTSVPYFKLGKSGITLFQGSSDPHATLGYSVSDNDIWFDTTTQTVKYRSSSSWLISHDYIGELEDVDLTGLADGYVLRYDSSSSSWKPHEVVGGLASDWGSIAETPLQYDGYTGDVWSLNTNTNTANFSGNVSITDNLTVSGNATITGNLTFGNADTDTVALSAEIVSNIVPDADATYDLGSSTKTWNDVYTSGTVGSSATGALQFPVGTTAQRPGSATSGMVRFNSTTSRFEGYNGSSWINIDVPDDWGSVADTP